MSVVSCLCPTTIRRRWAWPLLLATFRAQTWPDRELVIVVETDDDALEAYEFFLGEPGVSVVGVGCAPGTPLGGKRNLALYAARGDFLAVFDDDDWRAPDWIADAVLRLETSGAGLGGVRDLVAWELGPPGRTLRYRPPPAIPWWLAGATFVFRRGLGVRWPEIAIGEDAGFLVEARLRGVKTVLLDAEKYVWCVHAESTGRPAGELEGESFAPEPIAAEARMGLDAAVLLRAWAGR